MATNWSLFDGAKAILANDESAIAELGKRFPLTTVAIAAIGNNENVMKIFGALPINVTMRKVEANLKGSDEEVESDGFDTESDDEEPAPKKSKKSSKTDEDKKAAAAERRKARRAAKKAEKKAEEEEADEEEAEEEAEGTEYSSMNAVELFKECKKRGIKAAPKQKAAEYIKLLKAADAEEEAINEPDDSDDWEDDEEETPAPKKAAKSSKSKKAAKEEDEDDDWDI